MLRIGLARPSRDAVLGVGLAVRRMCSATWTQPEWTQHRLRVWEDVKEKQRTRGVTAHRGRAKGDNIEVRLPSGERVLAKAWETTPQDLLQVESMQQKEQQIKGKEMIVASVDGKSWDLTRPLESDCRLTFLSWEDGPQARSVFWHSSAHILGSALEVVGASLFRDGTFVLLDDGPPLDTPEGGFFYDSFVFSSIPTRSDVESLSRRVSGRDQQEGIAIPETATLSMKDVQGKIESAARTLCKQRLCFERMELTLEEAKEMFGFNPFKMHFLNKLSSSSSPLGPNGDLGLTISAYKTGDFVDLCRGPHLPHSGLVRRFRLRSLGSVIWGGKTTAETPIQSQDQPLYLRRITATSFPLPEIEKEHEELVQKAKERSHLIIQKQQQLVMFHPFSPGSPFFLPHGTRIYNKIIEFLRSEYRVRGFQEVITPVIFKKQLWEQSGHWENYREDMFHVDRPSHQLSDQHHDHDHENDGCCGHHHGEGEQNQDPEAHVMGLKPMNCPAHCLMFASTFHNFRDLPVRFADFGVLHRSLS